MSTNLQFPATPKERFPNTTRFCTTKCKTMDTYLMILCRHSCLIHFFTRRRTTLSRPDGFMLYGNFGVDLFSTSELLCPHMKLRVQLSRAEANLNIFREKIKVSFRIVVWSLYIRRVALSDDYQERRKDMLAYTPMGFNYLETLAKISTIPAKSFFNNAPFRQIAIAMNTKATFKISHTENPI